MATPRLRPTRKPTATSPRSAGRLIPGELLSVYTPGLTGRQEISTALPVGRGQKSLSNGVVVHQDLLYMWSTYHVRGKKE